MLERVRAGNRCLKIIPGNSASQHLNTPHGGVRGAKCFESNFGDFKHREISIFENAGVVAGEIRKYIPARTQERSEYSRGIANVWRTSKSLEDRLNKRPRWSRRV